ncbi:MAG: DUF1552 domain-containing protein, partial [Myxococcota bacterium]
PTGSESSWTSGQILRPLDRHKSSLVVLDRINNQSAFLSSAESTLTYEERLANPGAPHDRAVGQLLTGRRLPPGPYAHPDTKIPPCGYPQGESIDQFIARRLPTSTPLRSLELGVTVNPTGARPYTRMIYDAAGNPLPPISNPQDAFTRVTSRFPDDTPTSTPDPAKAKRGAILADIESDFARLLPSLSRDDRRLLDSHWESVKSLRASLADAPVEGLVCTEPGMSAPSRATFEEYSKLQIRVMVAALACGVTRVGSIMYSTGQGAQTFNWLDASINEQHHDLSHTNVNNPDNAAKTQKLTLINAWYATQVATLLDELAAVPEGEGTMLDYTAVLWVNELSDGWAHKFNNIPYVLAGGSKAGIETGRFVNCGDAPHNNLLLAIAHKMGVTEPSFGEAQFCTGPLAALM